MLTNIWVEIIFIGLWQYPLNHAFKLIHDNVLRLEKKYNIFNVRVKAAVQLAAGNTIWIGNKDFNCCQTAEYRYCASFRQVAGE